MAGVELATAYISIIPETSKIAPGINKALGQAESGAAQAGQRTGGSFAAGLGKGMAALGGFAALAAGLKSVVNLGNDFTTSMNTLRAVSGATEQQLAAVSARAKELGNDISLPGTSASDAAAAMTELAKGGFSVEQSMAAAKGTLQLAAAAQIDAAQAATIQSQALQAFGQDASFAGTAADILANAANASSAEIADVANGLQQSGTVANQFGLTMSDTATALAMFANAGIQGSDAGTLLKTALLALTDQGNPAQGAIEELGLTVYDTTGKFVGLESLFGQLQTASKNMTPEMYQAATATLFGSDAMRLSGVAAQQGAEGFDKMQTAINRQGAAAEVAAAKSQGLPGAMAAVENSVETLALGFYDLVKGPMESFALKAADIVSSATPGIISGLTSVGGALGTAADAFGKLPSAVQVGVGALVVARIGMALFGEQLGLLATRAGLAGLAVSAAFGKMGAAYTAAAAGATRFSAAAGVAAVAGRGLAAAGSGILSALGGPFVLALTGAAVAVTQMVSANNKTNDSMRVAKQTAEEWTKANIALRDSLAQSGGVVNQSVLDASASNMDLLRSSSQKLADDAPGFWARAALGVKGAVDMMDGELEGNGAYVLNLADTYGKAGQKIVDQMDASGKSSADLAKIITSTDEEFLAFINTQRELGNTELAGKLADQRLQFLMSKDAAIQVKDAIGQIEDKAVGAAGGVDALTNAVGKLRDDSRTSEEAQKSLTTALDGFKRSVTDGGTAAVDAAGKINLSTSAGVHLDDQMGRVATAWDEAGAAARTSAADQHLSAQDTERAVADAQGRVRQQFIDTAVQAGYTQEQAQGLANVFLAWPPSVSTAINVDTKPGWDQVQAWRNQVEGVPLTVKLYTEMVTAPPGTMPGPTTTDQLLNPTGRAAGGPITGGTPGKDSVLIAGMPGEHMLTVDDVNALGGQAGVYAFRHALHMAAGGAVPKGVADAAAAARSVTGNPYVWGGSGPTGFDCSGFMGWLQQILMGQPSNKRLYTTYSLLGGSGAGLQPGAGPAGTWFQVGVNEEHMAGTLGGQPVEAGGSHDTSRIGSPAVGASNGQFTNMYYLPTALIVGGAGTAYSGATTTTAAAAPSNWSEQDELDLERARIGVGEAQKKQNELAADATELDRRQAAVDVREAQARAAELEQRKAGKAVSPEAPGLETKYTDEQIELERARLAVESARLSRNDVYADATKTPDDRLDADLGLAAAQNAYTEKLTGKDKSGPMGTKERLKKLGADLVGVGIDAAMEQLPFGIGQSRWWDVPTSFPKAETEHQLPVTTGGDPGALAPYADNAPEWVKRLFGDMAIYDDGGWLKPGGIAVNLGRKPEPIFNSPAQLAEFAGAAFPASNTPALNIENVRGYDPQAVAREVIKQFRFEQMRHTGRAMVTS